MIEQTRTVHAKVNGREIVRYDKARKWYIEGPGVRFQVNLDRAVDLALKGTVYYGRPGGEQFDRIVKYAREKR